MFAFRFAPIAVLLLACAEMARAQSTEPASFVVKLDMAKLPEGARQRLGKITGFRYAGDAMGSAAAFSPNGKLLAAANNQNGGAIDIIDVVAGKKVNSLKTRIYSSHIVFSADSRSLVIDGQQKVHVYEVATGKQLQAFQLANPQGRQYGPSVSAQGRIVAVAGERRDPLGNQEGAVNAWDVLSGKELGPFVSIHNSNFRALVAPDGKTMIGFGQFYNRMGGMQNNEIPRTIQVWDVATGKEARKIVLDDDVPVDAAFSADGKTLALASGMSTIRFIDYETGKETRRFSGRRGTGGTTLRFSPDGELLVALDRYSMSHSTLQAWEVKTGKRIELVDGPKAQIAGAAFPGNKRVLALGRLNESLCWWDATSDASNFQGHLTSVAGLAFAPDRHTLISAGSDNRVFWWDLATGKSTREQVLADTEDDARYGGRGYGAMSAFALAPNARLAATGDYSGSVRLWDLKTGRPFCDLEAPRSHSLPAFAFSSDSSKLASSGGLFPFHIWNIETGQELPKLPAENKNNFPHNGGARLAFSSDGSWLAVHTQQVDGRTGRSSPELIFWDLKKTRLIERHSYPMVNDGYGAVGNMAFSSDSQFLALSDGAGSITLFKSATGKEWRKFTSTLRNSAFQLAFSNDGRFLAAGAAPRRFYGAGGIKRDEANVEIWEIAGGLVRERYQGHTGGVTCMAYSPDGTSLVTGAADTTILQWDLTGRSGPSVAPITLAELPQAWQTLTGNQPATPAAMRRMIAAPEATVVFLKEHFVPSKGEIVPEKTLSRLVSDLDSSNYQTRRLASKELQRLGARAEATLLKSMSAKPSVEARRRMEELLEQIRNAQLTPLDLQATRGVEILERIGTPDARAWLQVLAQGDPISTASREASVALKRMK